MFDYSPQATDHFLHPRHLGTITPTDIQPATERLLIGDAGQVTRGEALRLTVKLRSADERILDARFQSFGNGLAIASASQFCETIIGKTLKEAQAVGIRELDTALHGLPELMKGRPVLALDAFAQALMKHSPPAGEASDPVICFCFQVPESVIERAIRLRGLDEVDAITRITRAGAGCHTCHPDLEEIIERCQRGEYKVHLSADDYELAHRAYKRPLPSPEELARNPARPPIPIRTAHAATDGFVYPDRSPVATMAANATARRPSNGRNWKAMSYPERVQWIESVLEYDLRPAIRRDGGDVQLVDLKENRILVSLHGHCKSCHSAMSTLKEGIEKHMQSAVWPELEVEEVF